MLIRTMNQLEADDRVISIAHGKATAVRLLTKADRLGFSVSEARTQQDKPAKKRFSIYCTHNTDA